MLILVACAAVLYLAWQLQTVIRLAAISLFLALALLPITDRLDRARHVPRAVVILVIYLLLAAAVVVIGDVVVPSVVSRF